MSKQQTIWLTILIYILFIATISIVNHRKSKNMTEFTVGSRNAGGWTSAFSYGTAYFSAVMFIGYAGASGWKYGLWSVLPGICNALFGSLLAWIVLAKRTRAITREHKIKSMPQFFETRFSSVPMRWFSVCVTFIFLLPYSASVYKGLSSVCSVLLDVDELVCMIIIAVAAAMLVVIGGYAAAVKADFFQGIIMLVGVVALIIAVVRCEQVGGLEKGLVAITQKTKELNLNGYHFTGLAATVLMTSFGTWGLPQMIHKYYGIKDNKEVKRGTIASTFFALIVAGGGYFIGSLSHLFFEELPLSPSGTGNPDYIIPNMMIEASLSNILIGVILVLLIAASVSTLSSITLTASSTLTMDALNNYLPEKFKGKNLSIITKIICFLFVVFSFIIANTNTPILDMMSYSWGVISGSFLAPYLIALYWKKLNLYGAWAGMLGGFFTALPPLVAKLFGLETTIAGFGKLSDMGPHFACLAMIVSIILCFIGTLVTMKSDKGRNEEFYRVIN
ncbi:sodium:solute symporter family protein [Eubacteriales bacterium OttesenSCG-928-G02]|nr:sodium:solute symporter family protein [Eubacteriales bacterium OttesenSCG-928-G02]